MRTSWLTCDLALAAGEIAGGMALVSVTCGPGASCVAAPMLGGSGAMSTCRVKLVEICGVGAASSATPALRSVVGEAARVRFAMGGSGG